MTRPQSSGVGGEPATAHRSPAERRARQEIRKIETGVTNPSIDVLLRMTQGIGASLADAIVECEQRLAAMPENELDAPYILSK